MGDMQFSEQVHQLYNAGFTKGAPSIQSQEIDSEVVLETPCDTCGGMCDYHPFTKGKAYRAFYCCQDCGNWAEF